MPICALDPRECRIALRRVLCGFLPRTGCGSRTCAPIPPGPPLVRIPVRRRSRARSGTPRHDRGSSAVAGSTALAWSSPWADDPSATADKVPWGRAGANERSTTCRAVRLGLGGRAAVRCTVDIVGVARSLQPLVRAHADEAERNRRISDPVRNAMASEGLYRMGAPAAYGGLETPPRQMIEAIEAISMADGATGWTLMIGVESVGIAIAAMDPDTAASAPR